MIASASETGTMIGVRARSHHAMPNADAPAINNHQAGTISERRFRGKARMRFMLIADDLR